jgi:hypothetical protein
MAKKRCRKGVVKSGPRKGKCRKVCPKNCAKARKAPKRRAAPKRKTGKRANCEKFGYSVLLGRCRKSPARRGRASSSSDDAYAFPASAWSSSPQRVEVRDVPRTGSSMILYGRR